MFSKPNDPQKAGFWPVWPCLLTSAALIASGCSATDQADPQVWPVREKATKSSEIVGGTTDFSDPNVFMIAIDLGDGSVLCSATLIGNRTLVTAAHCLDGREPGTAGTSIWATNYTDAHNIPPSGWFRIIATRVHSGWDPVSLDNDVAMALLETAPAVPPKPWNHASMSAYAGNPVRVVGYGITGKSALDVGVKREASLVINSVDAHNLFIGDGAGKGICHGDSGGPTFYMFSDGVERLVGIHSYDANQQCTSGGDVRVDAYADFIESWLNEKETPECGMDGLCHQECTPVDPDCLGIGHSCESALQCDGRECVADPQHTAKYCSRSCDTNSQCPTGMECAPEVGVCTFTQLAVAAPGPAPAVSPQEGSATPHAAGCTTTGGGPLVLLPFMAWVLRSWRPGRKRASRLGTPAA